ncbi:UDP-3-O-acyl-N-acetylglucosamine deacetylase [Kolteria novifilia]|uniref:UDP-3-O-acyl-N-acetylglucosamine deacetylase n=1 Tax=Kolteria novifilia TaxID=2527975 RepID=UPI003AF3785F
MVVKQVSSSLVDAVATFNHSRGKKFPEQRTLAGDAEVTGIGFVSGADVTVRFRPAEPESGIIFVRTDLPNHPRIPAHISRVVERQRRTALSANGATVEMTEHLLAALVGLGIDNAIVELDAPEAPGVDGSSKPFVDAILAAGIVPQGIPRRPFVLFESASVKDGDALVAAHPGPEEHLAITFNLDYPDPAIGKQSLTVTITPEFFRDEIASARTFILEREIEFLRSQGLGTRSTARDLLVFGEDGTLIDNELRYPDECVRHKILDVIGDLALFGRRLHGHVLAHRSGHRLNAALVREITEQSQIEYERRLLTDAPVMDSSQIEQTIPHRFPFMLVDQVLELSPNQHIVAIKNVTYNEPFFTGHWPGKKVMPGVLIIESLAQAAGIMVMQWQGRGYGMVVSMDHVKLRRPVVPGDRLWLECVGVRVKDKTAIIKTTARVNRQIAAEAEMRFVRNDQSDELLSA